MIEKRVTWSGNRGHPDYYMERRAKRTQIVLILAISSVISFSPVYLGYATLAASDFFSFNLNFENVDQDYLLAAHMSELKIFRSSGFFEAFEFPIYPFERSLHFLSRKFSSDQKSLILRC
jgi:hypothetical protein